MRRLLLVLTALGTSATALAEDAASVLANTDSAMNQAKDQTISWDVVNQVPGEKEPRSMAFDVKVKGEMQLTEFHEPADLKGTRVLVMERGKMYIYLPAFKKVRRVASHNLEQGFMGTTYANFDLSANQFGDVFTPTLKSEDDASWHLSLQPKEGAEVPYAKAEITIRKEDYLPLEISYFNDKGEKVKTETRSDYGCEGKVCTPGVLRMTDHTRNGAWTELRRTEWAVDQGLDDAMFSVRYLQQGG